MAIENSVLPGANHMQAVSDPWPVGPDRVGPVKGLGSEPSIERFHDALRLAQAPVAAGGPEGVGATEPSPVVEPGAEPVAGPAKGLTYGRIDAATGLPDGRVTEREEPGSVPGHRIGPDTRGDTILNGLSQLRSAFDSHADRLTALSSSDATSTEQLIAVQVELAKFSLLIDVTSKLAGKSAQAFDTLMKGQ